jgi:hypothetical protein
LLTSALNRKIKLSFPTHIRVDLDQNGTGMSGHKRPGIVLRETRDIAIMAIHRKILEWQAAHPSITWIGWGIVWLIVLAILLWPRRSG